MAELEAGAASLIVSVEDGILVVAHGTDGSILLKGPLPAKGWNKLCKTLVEIAPKAKGIMKDNH